MGNTELDEFEASALNDFLGQHWQLFVSHMAQLNQDEGVAEQLYAKLSRLAGQ